ncbi:Dabb family protein [Tepidibacillus marianensis]|uniref:Dabb family protein n=1 Tax=Tepidibacillus marianensis TaxID=3131995 RepID=UPI0030D0175E
MIKHIVMWKLLEFAEGNGKEVNVVKMKDMLENLKTKINEIRTIEVGINLNTSSSAYDIVLSTEFESINDLNVYLSHPEHIKVSDFITKIRANRVVVDYEIY